MKKFLYALVVAATVFLADGCNKSGIENPGNPGDTANIPGVPVEGIKVPTSVFGRIVDEADQPLSGVTIAAGGSTTTTDVNGIYFITDLQLDQARAYVTATKAGFFKGSRIFQPVKNGLSKPPLIKMLAQKSIGTINAAAGGAVQSKGGTRVELPAAAIKDYSGNINVVVAYINPTAPDFGARMPGDLAADNAGNQRGALVSYGMSHIDLLDDKGNKLTIKEGMQATISIPVPTSLQASAAATIPLWYFDETKGIWKEEGVGTYQNGKYVGKVAHFSVWNYDHFSPLGMIPFFLRWILSKVSNDDVNNIQQLMDHSPDFNLTVRDKATKNTLYTNTFPQPRYNPNSNPPEATSSVTFPLPTITENMEVTVTPVQPGGPDYPTNPNYSPNADETPAPEPTFAQDGESTTVDVRPTNPPSTVTIIVPPGGGGGGGNGETVVNVNGKAINCNGQPVKRGYVYMSMRSGNTIVKTTTAPVFGDEGRFTAQYVFFTALRNRIDNVVLTVYDLQTGKKTGDLRYNVNPSVAYMIAEPVRVCEDNTAPANDGKVFTGNYAINDERTLKAFIDSGYNTVNGILFIANVSDLSGITKLKKVWGLDLRNSNITTLGGIGELEDITAITVAACNQLSILAFPKLATKSMQGWHINNNLALTAITFPSVENVSPLGNDVISITGSPLLKTLSVPQLRSVDKCGGIEITNSLLTNLSAFANASGTLGSSGLNLVDNPELTSLTALRNITVTTRLMLDQNSKLTSLDGLKITPEVRDYVTITRNTVLTDISAVGNALVNTNGLSISLNPALTAINFPLYEQGSLSLKENVQLVSISLPKCKTAGSVIIDNFPRLTSINLNALETAPQGVSLWGGYNADQVLTSFDLPALRTCGSFNINNCPAIARLDGFNNLETVNGDLNISNANIEGTAVKLVSINGFNKLASLPFSLNLETACGNRYNGPLSTIQGFRQLATIGGMLNLGGTNLTDITGFSSLRSIGQDLRVVNTGLANMNGLGKLASCGAAENRLMNITDNARLTSLSGLNALTTSMGVFIARNPSLQNLDGLEKVTAMRVQVLVTDNAKLANINGLVNVAGSTVNINISNNTILSNLCGIATLVKAGGASGDYRVTGNAYNPTVDDLRGNRCSQ